MDRKGSRENPSRASRPRKRKMCGNRYTLENETSFASTSSEKLLRSGDREITIDNTHAYRILHFFSVFSTISTLVNCKTCNKDITFKEASSRGLGFKIAVTCECGTAYINSCPLINNAYEINRRIVMVMRLLGIGNEGLNLFCGLMDLAGEFYSKTYYSCLTNIKQASQAVYKILVKHAVDEEKQKTLEKEDSNVNLTVCGDGTWKKRGYSSLYCVTTLTGKYSYKIIDSVVKSSYCKMCEVWEKKSKNEEEFEEGKESHQELCTFNHDGSPGKMEVDSVKEMFQRSIAEYGVKYTRYVGDGNSKTFKGILDLNPYDVQVKKLECSLDGNKQNDNESYNGLLWHFAPKHIYCGLKTLEIANYLAVGIFNEGYYAILKVFETMGVLIGPTAKQFSDKRDNKRLLGAERQHLRATGEARIAWRKAQAALNELYEEEEGVFYGIAD